MPDPTDPFSRLEHLAPEVDTDAGAAALTRRRVQARRRRRTLVAGGAAAAVVVLAGVALAVAPGSDGEHVRAGGVDTTTTAVATTPPAPVAPDRDERRTATTDQGLSLAMDTPLDATVGERMWVDVELTNGRPDPITVDRVGGCHDPLGVAVGRSGAISSLEAANEPLDLTAPGLVDQSIPWDGDPATLVAAVDAAQPPKLHLGRPSGVVPYNGVACADVVTGPQVVEPGGTIHQRIAVDLRWVDTGSADGRSLDVLARTGPVAEVDGTPIADRIEAVQPVVLHDPVDRAPSRAGATGPDGIAAAPTLDDWLAMTADVGPGNQQTYTASLTWWQGGWEAWLTPEMGTGHQADPLRIRFDPERGEVTDVRTVFWNLAPADDPDQPDPLPEPVDEIRFQAD